MNAPDRTQASSIAKTVFLFLGIQVTCILYIAINTGVSSFFSILFSVGSHITLFGYLMFRRSDIRSLATNRPFPRINIANRLTIFRISSTPTFCYFCIVVFETKHFALLLVIFATLSTLTDLLDGMLSRKLNQTSYLGKHLDSMADYFLLISLTLTYLYINFLPMYYVIIIAIRYCIQALIAIYLFFFKSTYASGATTLGKITVFLLVFYLDFQLLRFFPWFTGVMNTVNRVLLWVSTGLMSVSFTERVYLFLKDIRRSETKKRLSNT